MARIITKFKYINPDSNQKPGRYATYIATREGVEKRLDTKTYADYIATRPRSNGLFSNSSNVDLAKVSKDLNEHEGYIWTGIISLQREDAERLGYNSSKAWQGLLCSEMEVIARNFKISMSDLQWYAAFHNESHHPHVHVIFYSKDEKEGFLSKKGIENIRSELANDIFEQEQVSTFKKQTEYRDELKAEVKLKTDVIVEDIKSHPNTSNSEIEKMMKTLSERLSKTTGKKVYGYLSHSNKSLVDDIVKEISKDPKIAELYELWYQQKENTIAIYTDTMPKRIELWENPEFKSIKNLVVKAAVSSENTLQNEENGSNNHFYTFDLICNAANIIQSKLEDKDDKDASIDSKQQHKIIEKREAHGLHY